MSSSKEFKQAVREGRLNEALAIVIGNASKLHITTAISDNDLNNSSLNQEKSLQTHIDFVQGNITNKIEENLIEDNLYSFIQDFHLQQVTQGHQIVNQNLQSVQQIFRLLTALQQQKEGKPYTPLNTWSISDTALPASVSSSNYESDLATAAVTTNSVTEFALASQSDELQTTEEDDDIVNELLSLDDIEIEQPNPPENEIEKSAKNDEDWGDWLKEDNLEDDVNVIGLDDLEIEQSEDWGDETEFIPDDRQN